MLYHHHRHLVAAILIAICNRTQRRVVLIAFLQFLALRAVLTTSKRAYTVGGCDDGRYRWA